MKRAAAALPEAAAHLHRPATEVHPTGNPSLHAQTCRSVYLVNGSECLAMKIVLDQS